MKETMINMTSTSEVFNSASDEFIKTTINVGKLENGIPQSIETTTTISKMIGDKKCPISKTTEMNTDCDDDYREISTFEYDSFGRVIKFAETETRTKYEYEYVEKSTGIARIAKVYDYDDNELMSIETEFFDKDTDLSTPYARPKLQTTLGVGDDAYAFVSKMSFDENHEERDTLSINVTCDNHVRVANSIIDKTDTGLTRKLHSVHITRDEDNNVQVKEVANLGSTTVVTHPTDTAKVTTLYTIDGRIDHVNYISQEDNSDCETCEYEIDVYAAACTDSKCKANVVRKATTDTSKVMTVRHICIDVDTVITDLDFDALKRAVDEEPSYTVSKTVTTNTGNRITTVTSIEEN